MAEIDLAMDIGGFLAKATFQVFWEASGQHIS